MTKAEARPFYQSERINLNEDIRQACTEKLLERFKQIKWDQPIGCVHLFRPILSKKEIDPHPFLDHLRTLYPDLIKVVPRMSSLQNLEHIIWEETTPFSTNPLGIAEPLEGTSVRPEDIDLVFVPCLIFDQGGTRVGYGKGFYDRFLATCRPDVIKVGMCLFDAISPLEDASDFDIPLSIGITPSQLYEFV
jgi:5-formyltetrahydrofolate cyclo-ligase